LRKVLILSAHGGNFVLQDEVRRLNMTYPDLIVLLPTLIEARPDDPPIWEKGADVHAEEAETSIQLYLNPEHVKDERVDYLPEVGREFWDYAFLGSMTEWGVWGYPSYGTAEKGERFVAHTVRRLAEWARRTFEQVAVLRGLARFPGKPGVGAIHELPLHP
jgi:creatinine amidohydrolase